MIRKVVVDTDPGIDDAIALAMLLLDDRWDVLGVTPTGGNVSAEAATRNVQIVIEQLDPPRLPRVGAAPSSSDSVTGRATHIHGSDGLGESHFQVAELHHRHPADKLIVDLIRSAPHEVTLIALGPMTNIARAFERDPELPSLVGHLVCMGGAVASCGNITPAAEFNMYCDPESARRVFQSPCPKTLIPLDVTEKVVFSFDHFDRLPGEGNRVGRFLRRILPYAFRAHHEHLAIEGTYLHDAVAVCAAARPDLFRTEKMAGDVETIGRITRGATVFDRRSVPAWSPPNFEVAMEVDSVGVVSHVLKTLGAAAGEI